MNKLIIPLTGKSESEIENNMIFSSMNWDALMPTINQFARLRPDEVIEGIICDEAGIKVTIGRKKGPKKGSKQKSTSVVVAEYKPELKTTIVE